MSTCTDCGAPIHHRQGHAEYGERPDFQYRLSTLRPDSDTCPQSPTGYHYPEPPALTWQAHPFDRWPTLRAWAAEVFQAETPGTFLAPPPIRRALTRIYSAYPTGYMPAGICDPMWIANVIASEVGFGDGCSNFYPVPARTAADLEDAAS